MVVNSPNQGIPEQQGADPANLPAAQVSWDSVMENRLFQRYASVADRTARNAAPNENEASALADLDRVDIWNTANWISFARRSLFFLGLRNSDAAAINNSVTLVSDAVMTAALEANAEYMVDGSLYYDSSNTADFKMSTVWPGGTTGRLVGWGLDTGGTTQIGSLKQQSTTTSAATWSFVGAGTGAGNTVFCSFEGRLATAGAGNLVVQYAQNTLDATNTVVRSGSFLRVVRTA